MSLSKEVAIASLNKSGLYGNTNSSSIQCWPSDHELSAKSEETLNELKFTKVEWNVTYGINNIRFTLSDGSVSPQIGTY